jgi:DNA-binding PadR family transcriptional regulator
VSTTRLLVLGVVAGWGTAHGYAIHNELVSWGADDWAKVRWGSIYHALKQLEREGKLSAAPAPDGSGRIDYSLTGEGREAFLDLVRGALADAGAHADRLAAGLAFLAVLPRARRSSCWSGGWRACASSGPRSTRPCATAPPGPAAPATCPSCSPSGPTTPRAPPPGPRG